MKRINFAGNAMILTIFLLVRVNNPNDIWSWLPMPKCTMSIHKTQEHIYLQATCNFTICQHVQKTMLAQGS